MAGACPVFTAVPALAVSPQCSFASGATIAHPLTLDEQRRELELVARVAAEVWKPECQPLQELQV